MQSAACWRPAAFPCIFADFLLLLIRSRTAFGCPPALAVTPHALVLPHWLTQRHPALGMPLGYPPAPFVDLPPLTTTLHALQHSATQYCTTNRKPAQSAQIPTAPLQAPTRLTH
ncbi:MAG: hypothetical protein J3K34DRAFT_398413 [Monoraphidium minutum]|nr:MAG: hypothetical protein J3K34DRAFT_398413 [Monoraphidium minutum]